MFGELMTINSTEPNSSTARVETPVDPFVKDQQSLELLDRDRYVIAFGICYLKCVTPSRLMFVNMTIGLFITAFEEMFQILLVNFRV